MELSNEEIKRAAEDYFKQLQVKDVQFKDLTFDEDTDEYYLMNCIATGAFGHFYTDDIQYSEWQNEIPDNWDLNRYFKAMKNLEEMFIHLSTFQTDVSDYFPEQRLIIQWPTGVYIAMRYVTGQGSDFSILPSSKEIPVIDFFLSWEDAKKLCKISAYEKAKWYIEELKKDETFSDEELDILYFKLGRCSASNSFYEIVNKKNIRKVLSNV